MPSDSVISIRIFVFNAEAKTFIVVCKRIVQINCSLSLNIFQKFQHFFAPDLASV